MLRLFVSGPAELFILPEMLDAACLPDVSYSINTHRLARFRCSCLTALWPVTKSYAADLNLADAAPTAAQPWHPPPTCTSVSVSHGRGTPHVSAEIRTALEGCAALRVHSETSDFCYSPLTFTRRRFASSVARARREHYCERHAGCHVAFGALDIIPRLCQPV